MKKRTWTLMAKPQKYDIKCDICKGSNIEWSEYADMIWCYDCKKDTRGTPNGLNGPVAITVSRMLGCPVDEINIQTNMIRIPERKKLLTIQEYKEFCKNDYSFKNK